MEGGAHTAYEEIKGGRERKEKKTLGSKDFSILSRPFVSLLKKCA